MGSGISGGPAARLGRAGAPPRQGADWSVVRHRRARLRLIPAVRARVASFGASCSGGSTAPPPAEKRPPGQAPRLTRSGGRGPRPRAPDVAGELPHQVGNGCEPPLAAESAVQTDGEAAPVQVPVEVQEVYVHRAALPSSNLGRHPTETAPTSARPSTSATAAHTPSVTGTDRQRRLAVAKPRWRPPASRASTTPRRWPAEHVVPAGQERGGRRGCGPVDGRSASEPSFLAVKRTALDRRRLTSHRAWRLAAGHGTMAGRRARLVASAHRRRTT